jgi:hypothetical protein
VAAVALGAGLRVWQYAASTSLWLDEIALVMGILNSDLLDLLTEPLPFDQVAPKGFLLVQKLVVIALGSSDYALRLFPFVCSLIALVAFWRLSGRMLRGIGPLAATLIFATASPFVMFGSVVKQYSTDVCVAVLMWWLAYEVISRPVTAKQAGWAAVIGAVLMWFSQPAVLMAAGLAVPLALWMNPQPTSASRWRRWVPVLACWGASALVVTAVSFASMNAETRDYLHRYWATGFAPDSLARALEIPWPWLRLQQLFGSGSATQAGLAYPLPELYAVLTAAGYGMLWLQHRRTGALLLAPVLVTLVAAVAHQYPFSDRLIVFLVPSFILAIASAIETLYRTIGYLSRPLGSLVAAGLILPAAYPVMSAPPVYRVEDVKTVLADVQALWQPDDTAYVYYGAAAVVTFYAAQYGLSREDYKVGGCHRGDSRRYLEELDTFRGRPRVWIVLTHALPQYREREDILAYLDTIGTRLGAFLVESHAVGRTALPAEAYLYDLSSTQKLAGSSAESFQLTGPSSADPRAQCGEGPHSMIAPDF